MRHDGYGVIRNTEGKLKGAHRVSYEIHKGNIPDGMCVLHTCDNPGCVNPEHLWLGTHKDNSNDMSRKGRSGFQGVRGSAHPSTKLSTADVQQIRELHSNGLRQVELAEMFGCHNSHISRIVRGVQR